MLPAGLAVEVLQALFWGLQTVIRLPYGLVPQGHSRQPVPEVNLPELLGGAAKKAVPLDLAHLIKQLGVEPGTGQTLLLEGVVTRLRVGRREDARGQVVFDGYPAIIIVLGFVIKKWVGHIVFSLVVKEEGPGPLRSWASNKMKSPGVWPGLLIQIS